MTMLTRLLTGTGLALVLHTAALAQTQGVSDTEIVIGTHTSLTGPVAPWGVGSTNAVRLRFEAENDKGGIHGRKIRYIVEDHGYQVPRAVQAGNKLLTNDKIFLMVAGLGTPMNNAILQKQIAMKVPNFGPFTAARAMSEPFDRYKFQVLSTYYTQIRSGLKHFVEKKNVKAPCVMYQDTDFGQEIVDAARDQAKAMNLKISAESGHKPTDTDFTGAITKLREAKCDLVLMGTIVRDTILPYATARKLGWNVDFLGSIATYEQVVASAEGGVTNGFYAMTSQTVAYADSVPAAAKPFMEAYKAKYGQDPPFPAQLGYGIADITVEIMKRAGKDLTADSFVKAAEGIKDYRSPFGGSLISFGPDKRNGAFDAHLAVIENGRWKTIIENLTAE